MNAPLLALESAELGYARTPVLRGVDCAVRPGDFIAVTGPNGGGKSTLLRGLLGSVPLRAGRRVARAGLRLGYVPQELSLDAEQPLTAADVVGIGAWSRGGVRVTPAAALEQVGLTARAGERFASLSGGQKQRVLLARALVCGPEVLLLDEPASAADPAAAAALYAHVARLTAAGAAAVLVTHHPRSLAGAANRVLHVAGGRVLEEPLAALCA